MYSATLLFVLVETVQLVNRAQRLGARRKELRASMAMLACSDGLTRQLDTPQDRVGGGRQAESNAIAIFRPREHAPSICSGWIGRK